MKTVTYVASSGKMYNLTTTTGFRLRNANFHKWNWGRDVKGRRYGEKILRFTRAPLTYECTLAFWGPTDRRAQQLLALHNDFERDVAMMTPGKIVWGSCYINCYIESSSTYPGDGNNYTENDIVIYCPYPYWIEEQTIDILPTSSGEIIPTAEDAKTYEAPDFGYYYDYSYPKGSEIITINNDHYLPSDFRLTAYGPATYVAVSMAGHLYEVDHAVLSGERLVIDSREICETDKRIYLVSNGGAETSLFDYRNPATSVFRKLPPGTITINYARNYGITLTIFKERSEPR